VRRAAAILGVLIAAAATLPAGQVAAQDLPPRATASLRVPASCPRTRTVRFVVTGREIERVKFWLDGRRMGTLTAPNDGTRWVFRRSTRSLRAGLHRLAARVVFTERSGRPATRLRGSIRRCRR
jgi:hypothetical protein